MPPPNPSGHEHMHTQVAWHEHVNHMDHQDLAFKPMRYIHKSTRSLLDGQEWSLEVCQAVYAEHDPYVMRTLRRKTANIDKLLQLVQQQSPAVCSQSLCMGHG
eukprot:1159272-Pelagomonas_calceolata.AAC.2